MKKFLFCLCFTVSLARGQTWQWARTALDTLSEQIVDMENDSAGNLFIAGNFPQTISFGAVSLNTPTPYQYYTDVFLAKYDGAGNMKWIRQISCQRWDYLYDLCIDKMGNLLISGWCEDVASFGSGNTSQTFGPGCFTAKYSNSGNLLWVRATKDGALLASDHLGNIFAICSEVTVQGPHAPNLYD